MTSSELLLLFSFVSLLPVILFANQTLQALKGAERVGVESRWGGIGGGGGGWGLTRPATWLALTLFFALLSMVLIVRMADRAQAQEERRDAQVMALGRLALADHQAAAEAYERATTDEARAAAAQHLARSVKLHEGAIAALEALWGMQEAPTTPAPVTTPAAAPATGSTSGSSTVIAIPAREPGTDQPDINPRGVEGQ